MSTTSPLSGRTVSGPTTVDADEDVSALLATLHDPDCRAIIEATREEALSASELADGCDLPLSTTYRKLDLLTETGLLAEETRIRRSGNHTSEYRLQVEDVLVTVDADEGISLEVYRRERTERHPVAPSVGGY